MSKKTSIFKPNMLSVSLACYWAAQNQPAEYDSGTLTTWALTTLSVGVGCRAAFAILVPGCAIGVAYLYRSYQIDTRQKQAAAIKATKMVEA